MFRWRVGLKKEVETHVTLPKWLDDYIFNELGAKYCRSNADMTVIDWDKSDMLNYLGTYFPRSYAEAYCIFSNYLEQQSNRFQGQEELSLLDFGSGTGGEIIGIITVLTKQNPDLKKIKIIPIDGNSHALQLFDKVIKEYQKHTNLCFEWLSSPIHIDDFYDLSVLDTVLRGKYDIVISFKAICEFVTKQQFENRNAYEHIARFLMPKLTENGLFLLVDVTTYNDTTKEWLPKMLNMGLHSANIKKYIQNDGYSQAFLVTHSHKMNDVSKVAWRLITKA